MATYPASLVSFSTHKDGDLIQQADYNTAAAEIGAVESTLGAMPHVSTSPNPAGTFATASTGYASVSARLTNVETGVVSDAHSQYVKKAGGSTISPVASQVGLSIVPSGSTTTRFQTKNSSGTAQVIVDLTNTINAPNNKNVGTISDAWQTSSAQGSSTAIATTDHKHRGGVALGTSGSRPSSPYVGQGVFETDTNLLRVWNGTEWWAYEVNQQIFSDAPTDGQSVPATYANIPGVAAMSFTKRNSGSNLIVVGEMEFWFTAGAPESATLGVKVTQSGVSTNYDLAYHLSDGDGNTVRPRGVLTVSGLSAGAVSLQPIWKAPLGFASSGNTNLQPVHLIVSEI